MIFREYKNIEKQNILIKSRRIKMGRMIGIDLGTTNSLATYIDDNGEIQFVKNEYGNILIPSVVGIDENDGIIVGELAKERRMMNAGETASNFKRRMGTEAKIKVKNRTFDAQMLSSFVLKHLKESAEKQLNEKIDRAIIRIAIYQGESLNINDNLFLGEFEINVPRNNAGNEKVNVRFTYDINGILEAEATAMSTGEKRNKLIINGDLSKEEKNEKIKTLTEIKIQSENQNKDKLLIERANRIYAEIVNTEIRNYISEYLENYQMIVRTGDRIRIQKVKKEFSAFLDKIDPELNDLSVDDILRDIDEKEEDEAMEEEDELEFWN